VTEETTPTGDPAEANPEGAETAQAPEAAETTDVTDVTGLSISISDSAGGTVTGDGTYQEGDEITLAAAPEEGNIFDGWYENDVRVSTDANYTFTVATARTLQARFILPQTGIQNLTPFLAIIGIFNGFLMVLINALRNFSRKFNRKIREFKPKPMLLTYIGVLIIFLSAGVYGIDFYEDYKIYMNTVQTAQTLLEQIEENTVQEQPQSQYEYEQEFKNENKNEDANDGYKYIESGESVQTIEMDGEFYFGVLNIPSLGLELPVNNEIDDEKLNASPCRYSGNLSGPLIIAAHNYHFHFGNIARLEPGERLVITDAKGNQHWYAVDLIEIISGKDVDGMLNSPYALTLFTCSANGKDRITVRCIKLN
jgi:sortase A